MAAGDRIGNWREGFGGVGRDCPLAIGNWLNLIEGFFSKLARSVLRHIRVESKQELKDRITAAMDEFNQHPVVHTWSYKLDQAA